MKSGNTQSRSVTPRNLRIVNVMNNWGVSHSPFSSGAGILGLFGVLDNRKSPSVTKNVYPSEMNKEDHLNSIVERYPF